MNNQDPTHETLHGTVSAERSICHKKTAEDQRKKGEWECKEVERGCGCRPPPEPGMTKGMRGQPRDNG